MAQILGQALITPHEFDPLPISDNSRITPPSLVLCSRGTQSSLLHAILPYSTFQLFKYSQFINRPAKNSSRETDSPVSNRLKEAGEEGEEEGESDAQSGINMRDQRQMDSEQGELIGERRKSGIGRSKLQAARFSSDASVAARAVERKESRLTT